METFQDWFEVVVYTVFGRIKTKLTSISFYHLTQAINVKKIKCRKGTEEHNKIWIVSA